MSLGSLAPGTVFAGEYRVVRALSEGGMGAVYVVEQPSTGKLRALKVMHPGLVTSTDLRARFALEARVSGSIKSDHVVHVLAAGVDAETGVPWLTMELLDGEDLSHALERGPLSPQATYDVFFQLCHALGAAHAAGIVHRDLKPENVFLSDSRRADVPYTVKVLDFGIAKVVAEAQTVNTGAAGTPLYMAPEQTEAGSAISPRTDVWALGLLAFRMLTGRSYWIGGNSDAASPMMILRETLIDALVPASARAAQLDVAESLPPGFDAWFARCVARNPSERFAHAGEAFAALGPALGVMTRDRVSAPALGSGRQSGALISQEPAPAAPGTTGPTPPGMVIDEDPPHTERLDALPGVSPRPTWPFIAGAGMLVAVGVLVVAFKPGKGPRASGASTVQPTECPRNMALIHGGRFALGDTKRFISVRPFCMDLSEVTARSHAACVAGGQCTVGEASCSTAATYGKLDRGNHPMNCVSFPEATAHCAARGARLPTEEEWEWAARGGAQASSYPWGNDAPAAQLCWSGQASRSEPCPVGTFPTGDTRERLRDLAGNVAEWTSTPFGSGTDHVVYRGGSFAADDRLIVGAAARDHVAPGRRGERLGFRCAVDPTTTRSDVGAPF